MLQPSEAPIFYNLNDARQWVNLQSLAETFYLVKVERIQDTYEFWSADDLNGDTYQHEIIETWS